MENDYLIKQTLKIFGEIVVKLINPEYKVPKGGEPLRTIGNALKLLEKQQGSLSISRIVDYVICSAYVFKNRGEEWRFNQVFGPKSLERFNTNRSRRHFEDKWLMSENITRNDLIKYLTDKSEHPLAKFIYVASEEGTKQRLLNQDVGYIICQSSTLGWSPESESCMNCKFIEKCQIETSKKYPEIYRLRMEHGSKNKT